MWWNGLSSPLSQMKWNRESVYNMNKWFSSPVHAMSYFIIIASNAMPPHTPTRPALQNTCDSLISTSSFNLIYYGHAYTIIFVSIDIYLNGMGIECVLFYQLDCAVVICIISENSLWQIERDVEDRLALLFHRLFNVITKRLNPFTCNKPGQTQNSIIIDFKPMELNTLTLTCIHIIVWRWTDSFFFVPVYRCWK